MRILKGMEQENQKPFSLELDNAILELLQKDARMKLTVISKKLEKPVTTIYDHLKIIKTKYRFTAVPKGNKDEIE